jgi:hypothetical protein
MTNDRAIEAIRITGGAVWFALILSAMLAWHWMNMRFEASCAELRGKAEAFDALREQMQRREALEVPVPDVPRESARRGEQAGEAPVRGETR